MPEDRLWLDPQRALGGARDMVSAGQHLKELHTGDGAEIRSLSAGPPWGSDEIGAAFEKTYRTLEQQTLLSWERLAAYVEGLGYAVAQSVNNNVQTDGAAADRVRGTWRAV